MNNQNNLFDQEKSFHKALKMHGYIFPEKEFELREFEESISKMSFIIPEKFNNVLAILQDGRIENVGKFNSFSDLQIEENLAQAAREGSSISEEVLKQMEIDRKKSEKSIDNGGAK